MRHAGKLFAAIAAVALSSGPAAASTAYGTAGNFDTFNDCGQEMHGFEMELADVHSTDVGYTYDYNHYGAPRITEDNSDPAHPKVRIRHEATFDAAANAWSAYTAVPSSQPSPTDGHQCTDPSVNIGCEHFGVSYSVTPSAIRYHWLKEDPAAPGTLTYGCPVDVAMPNSTYYPPANGQPGQVQAVIEPPEPPEVPVREFGEASWVKVIRTVTHNANEIRLEDLVSDDPNKPDEKNWTNGEPAEVETEWALLQTEFKNPAGANNDLAGELEDLPNGDEVITRRYEFYNYAGPLDPESGEAKCDKYPPVADPADPAFKPQCDPASVNVLGDYVGAQMVGFDVEAPLGLIDHLQDGAIQDPYTPRALVVGGNTPYAVSVTGTLPPGLSLDAVSGVLSGTPTAAGNFVLTVTARDANATQVSQSYILKVTDPNGPPLPTQHLVEVTRTGAGRITGPGIDCGTGCLAALDEGSAVALSAAPNVGSIFDGWTGACAGTGACSFTVTADTAVGASFSPQMLPLTVARAGRGSGTVKGGAINCGATCSASLAYGTVVSLTATPAAGSLFTGWSGACAGTGACTVTMDAARDITATFAPVLRPLTVTTSGAGTVTSSPAGINCGADCQENYEHGTQVKLTAQAPVGHVFLSWSGACSGVLLNTCTVTMSQARSVTATFK